MASGNLSSCTQIEATAARFCGAICVPACAARRAEQLDRVGQPQRADRHRRLARHPQRFPAGRQDLHLGAGRQQRLVPQPVEPQQQATVGEARGGRARRGQAHRGLAHPGQPGHGDQRGSVQHAPDRGGLGGAAHQASRV
ncbi:MAG TPA: hypothetical protein VGL33_24965 [Streptosporangiaceae bacterium]|jgi:hypothetical protein